MGYQRAEDVLPPEILALVQEYVDGQMLYVPKKSLKRSTWGSVSGAKEFLKCRNAKIYAEYQAGSNVTFLAKQYFLSEKSIQRIIRNSKPLGLSQNDDEKGGFFH